MQEITEIEALALLAAFQSKFATKGELKKYIEEHKEEYEELVDRIKQLEADSRIIQCDYVTQGKKRPGSYVNLPVVDGKQVGYKSNTYTLVVSADGLTLANGYEYSEEAGDKANRIMLRQSYPRGTHFHFIIHGWVLADIPPADEDVETTALFGDTEEEKELGLYATIIEDDGTIKEVEVGLDATLAE